MANKGDESVRIVRPLKLIAFICCCVAVLVLGGSLTTSYWLEGGSFHQGLWEYCKQKQNSEENECGSATNRLWVMACGILAVVALLCCLSAAVISFVGLLTRSRERKRSLFVTAGVMALVAACSLLAVCVLFPVMLIKDIEDYRREYDATSWLFSWSYGLAWGSWLFMLVGMVLLFVNNERKADYPREKASYYAAAS